MKKTIILFIFLLLLITIVYCGYEYIDKKITTNKKKEDYRATLEEVELLYNNSSSFDYKLLDKPPTGTPFDMANSLRNNDIKDCYYIDLYNDTNVITTIKIESSDVNILGIAPGDNKDCIKEKLKDTNFKLTNKYDDVPRNTYEHIRYETALLCLEFGILEDGTISEISASVYDSFIPRSEYKRRF